MTTDPKRLLDPEMEVPPALRDALEVAREEVPDEGQLDALAARLAPWLGPGPGGSSPPGGGAAGGGGSPHVGGGATAAGGAAAGAGALKVGTVAALLAVGALGGVGLWAHEHARRAVHGTAAADVPVRHARTAPAPAPPVRATPPPSAAPSPSPRGNTAEAPTATGRPSTVTPAQHGRGPTAHRSGRAQATPPTHAARPTTARTAGTSTGAPGGPTELGLLEQAEDALSTSPARCLALTDEDGRRFPHGALVQEREVLAIEALIRLGRRPEARSRAERFRAAWPSSAQLPHIDELLARSSPGSAGGGHPSATPPPRTSGTAR